MSHVQAVSGSHSPFPPALPFSYQSLFLRRFQAVARSVQGKPGRVVCAALRAVVQEEKAFTTRQERLYQHLLNGNFAMPEQARGDA